MIYRYERRGRQRSTLIILAVVWAVLLLLWIRLDMALVVLLVLGAFTLPALWDVLRDTRATLEVWPNRLVWTSSLRSGDRSDIDHVNMSRRFDGSMRITLVHIGGAQTRLPPDVVPPTQEIETALENAGIAVQRHPFSLMR